MRILFVSYFCPPEVAAPAARVAENAARFARAGHEVTILTGLPNHPMGRVFPSYRYRLYQAEMQGAVRVVRVCSVIRPNTTTANRLLSYVSLMIAQVLGGFLTGPADVVIGTSPPLFQALAGWAISVYKRCPFVMEVRDLWPENMVAIGALRSGFGLRAMAAIESFLYRRAARIVAVTHGFGSYIADKGIPRERIAVITNGVDLASYNPVARSERLQEDLGTQGKFVAAYIGTIGINHGLGIMLETARLLKPYPDVLLLLVGDGAERADLEERARREGLTNVLFVGEKPRSSMPDFHAVADVILVLLKKAPYFRLVIPSKIFVAMSLTRPILIGVDGESRRIVEEARAGMYVEPEPAEVSRALLAMKELRPSGELEAMGRRGREHVRAHYDRDDLAQEYMRILHSVTGP